jgi:hypothetical protein
MRSLVFLQLDQCSGLTVRFDNPFFILCVFCPVFKLPFPKSVSTVPNPIETVELTDLPSASPSPETDWLHSPPKQSSGFTKKLIWLTVTASLGLHAALMLAPIPGERKPEVQPEEKKVRITQLPTLTKVAPAKLPAKVLPKTPPLIKRSVPIRPENPIPPIPQKLVPDQLSKQAVQEQSGASAWADFPQYPGATSGCFNLQSCMQTGKSLTEVSAHFDSALPTKKYEAKLTITEADRKVYQVFKGGITQFLSLIVAEGKGTVYVLAEAPRTLKDLAEAIEVPPEISSIFQGLGGQDVTRANFAQPELFYVADKPRPEIGDMQRFNDPATDTFFDSYFRTNLVNNGFEASDTPEPYQNGFLYTVKKEKLSLYIHLVPTQDKTETIVVVWKQLPK